MLNLKKKTGFKQIKIVEHFKTCSAISALQIWWKVLVLNGNSLVTGLYFCAKHLQIKIRVFFDLLELI